jgi:nitroreductase
MPAAGYLALATYQGRCGVEFYEVLRQRQSTREFTDEDLPGEVVDRLLSSAVMAPTAGNLQPWRFFVVRESRIRRSLSGAAFGQPCVADAPVVLVVCADLDVCAHGYGARGEHLYSIQDTAAAVENILLAAVAEGLGACWVGAFDERKAKEVLGLPPGIRPLAMVPVGYPARHAGRTPREPFEKFTKHI